MHIQSNEFSLAHAMLQSQLVKTLPGESLLVVILYDCGLYLCRCTSSITGWRTSLSNIDPKFEVAYVIQFLQ